MFSVIELPPFRPSYNPKRYPVMDKNIPGTLRDIKIHDLHPKERRQASRPIHMGVPSGVIFFFFFFFGGGGVLQALHWFFYVPICTSPIKSEVSP